MPEKSPNQSNFIDASIRRDPSEGGVAALEAPQLESSAVQKIDELSRTVSDSLDLEATPNEQALEELQSARMCFILGHDSSARVHLALAENFLLIGAGGLEGALEIAADITDFVLSYFGEAKAA